MDTSLLSSLTQAASGDDKPNNTDTGKVAEWPELLSRVPLIPLQKLPVRFSPEGLRKDPLSGGFFS